MRATGDRDNSLHRFRISRLIAQGASRSSWRAQALALGILVASSAAGAQQQYRCLLFDDTPQMADRDLSRDYPLTIRSCRPLARSVAHRAPTVVTAFRQYRCLLFDNSPQLADRDLSRDYPSAIKSCRALAPSAEPILARSVDTPVDALAFVAAAPLGATAVLPAESPADAPAADPARNAKSWSARLSGRGASAVQIASRHTTASQPVASLIQTASLLQGLDPGLVSALVYVESRYNSGAQSPKGAMGLMQIMPATAARYGVTSPATLMNPQVNVDVGTRYLRDLQRMFNGRTELVLAAYNAGEGSVLRYGNRIPPYPETQSYVRQIMALSGQNGG